MDREPDGSEIFGSWLIVGGSTALDSVVYDRSQSMTKSAGGATGSRGGKMFQSNISVDCSKLSTNCSTSEPWPKSSEAGFRKEIATGADGSSTMEPEYVRSSL